MNTNFCAVESDLDRLYAAGDMAEGKYKRIRDWLKSSGRVEDAILQSAREDGEFDEFVSKHENGYAVIQLGLLAIHPIRDFDADYLKADAHRVCAEYIAQEYDETLEWLIEKEWRNFE